MKRRFTLFLILFAVSIIVPTIIILIINFRNYSINNAHDKAKILATTVKDGLTVHMVNGIMDKRNMFLAKIKHLPSVKNLKILRSKTVEKQFGKSFESYQNIDSLEKEVLTTGKEKSAVHEDIDRAYLKIVIPYTASALDSPNCLQCHKAKEGEVLGAISMTFDISDVRREAVASIIKIILFTIVISFIGLYLVNRYTQDYMNFFDRLKSVLQAAYNGDYSKKLFAKGAKDIEEISRWLNALFEKIEHSLQCIQKNVHYFIDYKSKEKDSLLAIEELVQELAAIYKFKNIVEQDGNRYQIYEKIVELVKNKFKCNRFMFFEIDTSSKKRTLLYSSTQNIICEAAEDDITLCRAFATNSMINSDKYLHICPAVEEEKVFYICFPVKITEKITLLFSFLPQNKEEYFHTKEMIENFKNYIEVAKPVIETKLLVDELQEWSMKDRMTGAYNRRFLDIFVQKNVPQALRTQTPYSIMMLDIDHFKMVNDTYGHDAGDKVIKELVNTIMHNIRESDIVVRFGGEEFLILMYNCKKEDAAKVAQKIKESFKKRKIDVGKGLISKSVSIGISEFPTDTSHFWQAIKFADVALYKAKQEGRDKIVLFDESMLQKDKEY